MKRVLAYGLLMAMCASFLSGCKASTEEQGYAPPPVDPKGGAVPRQGGAMADTELDR